MDVAQSAALITSFTYEAGLLDYEEFPQTLDPVWVLGKQYSAIYELEELKRDVISRLWFTYRRGFPLIGGSGPSSDQGWGCMLRCGQMMVAQSLIMRHLGRKWRWTQEKYDPKYYEILRMFLDKKGATYSIHQIASMGMSEGKQVGEWFGPNTIAQVLRKLAVYDTWSKLEIHVALDNTVIIDDIRTICLAEREDISKCESPCVTEEDKPPSRPPKAKSSHSKRKTHKKKLPPIPRSPPVTSNGTDGDPLDAFTDPLRVCDEDYDCINGPELPHDQMEESCDQKPGSCDQKPGSCDQKSGSCDQKSGSCDQKSGSCDQKSGSCDQKSGSCDQKSGSCDQKSGSCDQKFGSCDQKSGSCDQKFGSCDQKPGSCDQKSGSCDQKSGSSDQKSGSCDQDAGKHLWKPLLLIIPLRLGLAEINSVYMSGLKTCLTLPQSVGIIGGKPNHAHWFVGSFGDELIYMDPHTCHNVADVTQPNQTDDSYHCPYISRMDIHSLDPSIALGFYCDSEADFDDLCSRIQKQLVDGERTPMFEIHRHRPRHWPPFHPYSPDGATGTEFMLVTDRQFDSEDDFELL